MNSQKVTFENRCGEMLSGRLELPENHEPYAYAIFAHCFTCNINLNSVINITRALSRAGFGVLRFDFTGLGSSEGKFEDTNFSSNVDDLEDAAQFLTENYKAPELLIGHSLGGAAVIFAADNLESVRAVATIGAPSNPAHVKKLFKGRESEIMQKGEACINLEGRDFTIKKQFLEDLENLKLSEVVHHFNKSLLIFHSPQDFVVGIVNAEEIYKAARHPKSFISLDGADHLLTKKEDSIYVGNMTAEWATRYIPIPGALSD